MTKQELVILLCKEIKAVTPKEKHVKRGMIEFYKERALRIEKLSINDIWDYSFIDEFNRKVSECTKEFKD